MQNVLKKLIATFLFIEMILSLWGPGALPDNTNPGGENSYQLLSDIPDKGMEHD